MIIIPETLWVKVRDNVNDLSDQPELLERFLAGLIEFYQPELAGVTIWRMRLDWPNLKWQVMAQHPSFDPVPFGDVVPEFVLGGKEKDNAGRESS
jgi:hypothetical protein